MKEILQLANEIIAYVAIVGSVIIGLIILFYIYKPTKNKNNDNY